MPTRDARERAFRAFLRRVWKSDVAPLLRDRHAQTRKRTARAGGAIAGATGLAVDSLLQLKGRPFTRFMMTMGASLGAMLPDAWNWKWYQAASAATRRMTEKQIAAAAMKLADAEALTLFDLPPSASAADLKATWRELSKRWHPDKARDESQRAEHHLRFVTYQAAYERLRAAYEAGRLPHA